jgi:hypothetical protein
MVAELADIVFDSSQPAQIARFWAAALDGYQVAPYDDAELERLRTQGISDVEADPTVLVEPVTGGGPRFFFQLVPERKTVKNRVHLDLRADDTAGELRRLIELGAQLVAQHQHTILMSDPEGNEFCLIRQ